MKGNQVRPPIAFFQPQGHRLCDGVFFLAFDELITAQNPDEGVVPVTFTNEATVDAGIFDGEDGIIVLPNLLPARSPGGQHPNEQP